MTVPPPPTGPEDEARVVIDGLLAEAGWVVQDRAAMNLHAGQGVAVREFPLQSGYADYLLFVDGKPCGVIEAKAAGHPLGGVEAQADRYSTGLPAGIAPPVVPLPFLYMSNGVDSLFVRCSTKSAQSHDTVGPRQPRARSRYRVGP